MSWTGLGGSLDARVGALAERAMRRISRRDALRGAVVGGTAGLAALTLGERPALAESCDCGPTRRCAGCPDIGCPGGYSLCKGSFSSDCFNGQGYRCEWPQGTWIACMNAGKGYGYKVCYDCINHAGCKDWCTCLSECICCDCASVRDIRAEQHRLQALDLP
ncbi:MAG: hypothetical protein ACLPN6_05645 [Streptosporangiaceae bacterium]|jgi:hypothetical protein|nr:hypothetical protein [Actinomycetota bacterium]